SGGKARSLDLTRSCPALTFTCSVRSLSHILANERFDKVAVWRDARRLSPRRPLSGFLNFVPATPTDNSQFWLWGIRQHRKQLEHISIRVTEIKRRSRHPAKHYRFVGRLPPKVKRNNIGGPKKRR